MLTASQYVRCSVYAHIDIALKTDPSCRAIITIVQPVAACIPRLLAPVAACIERPVFGTTCLGKCCNCCPCCCTCCCAPEFFEDRSSPLGTVSLSAALARAGYAPGEELTTVLRGVNALESSGRVKVVVRRSFTLTSSVGSVRTPWEDVVELLDAPISRGQAIECPLSLLVPLLSPDYHGGALAGLAAYKQQFLPPGEEAYMPAEPVLWRTALHVELLVPDTPVNPAMELPLFICALPLLPAQERRPGTQAMSAAPPQDGRAAAPAAVSISAVSISAEELAANVDLLLLMREPPRTARMEAVDARHAQEDMNCDAASLQYEPAYFVATPLQKRFTLSPYKPTYDPLDASDCPPGATMLCPYTEKPFVVKQWLIDSATARLQSEGERAAQQVGEEGEEDGQEEGEEAAEGDEEAEALTKSTNDQ